MLQIYWARSDSSTWPAGFRQANADGFGFDSQRKVGKTGWWCSAARGDHRGARRRRVGVRREEVAHGAAGGRVGGGQPQSREGGSGLVFG